MSEFVRENGFKLARREAGEAARGQQDHRAQPADDGGHFDARGLQKSNGPRDADARGELAEFALPRFNERGGPAEFLDEQPAGEKPARKCKHAQRPRRDEPRQGCFEQFGESGFVRDGFWRDGCGGSRRRRGCSGKFNGCVRNLKGLYRELQRWNFFRTIERIESCNRCGGHQQEGETSRQITCVGGMPPQNAKRDAGEHGDDEPLPQEVEQRPAEAIEEIVGGIQGGGCLAFRR